MVNVVGAPWTLARRIDGQSYNKFAPAFFTFADCLDAPPMQRDELFHKSQTNSQSSLGAIQVRLDLRVHLENVRQHLSRDANSGVANSDNGLAAVPLNSQADTPSQAFPRSGAG